MKKTWFIILASLVVLLTSCTQNTVVLTEAELPDDIFYLQDELKPFTGKAIIYFNSTETVKEEMNYKKGYLDGERVSYYKNGQVKLQGEYNKGKYDGAWKKYSAEGNMLFIATYQNDSLVNYESHSEEDKNVMLPNLVQTKESKKVASVLF